MSCLYILLLFLMAQQPLSVKACLHHLWGWLSMTFWITPHSRIVSPTYGTVYLGLEPMTGMLFSRTSWRLYHETGCLYIILLLLSILNCGRFRYLLVIKYNVRQPNVFGRHVQLGDTTVLSRIPLEFMILPFLMSMEEKAKWGVKNRKQMIIWEVYQWMNKKKQLTMHTCST